MAKSNKGLAADDYMLWLSTFPYRDSYAVTEAGRHSLRNVASHRVISAKPKSVRSETGSKWREQGGVLQRKETGKSGKSCQDLGCFRHDYVSDCGGGQRKQSGDD